MHRNTPRDWLSLDLLFSLVILGLLFGFTYLFFVRVPYIGFYFNPANGEVLDIFVRTEAADSLQSGDMIKQVGTLPFTDYSSQRIQPLFEDAQPGDIVNITVERDGQQHIIPWNLPGFNPNEFRGRFFNIWWLAYIFWTMGLVTQLFIRPKDARRRLLIASNYLTALWLIWGSMSSSAIYATPLLLRAVTWLMLPVYLNLHWDFPGPLARMPKQVWIFLYLAGGILALFELFQVTPRNLYALGFLLALAGSLLLLFTHLVRRPTQRRGVGLLLLILLVAVIPTMILAILGTVDNVPEFGPLTFLVLPIMPIAYFFVIYRSHLGGLELRANRFMSIYSYMILLGTGLLLLLVPALSIPLPSATMAFLTIVIVSLTSLASIFLYPAFESFVEQQLLGIKLPHQNLLETYSSRITTSTSLPSLLQLLMDEVFPSLLVRQFAFLQISNDRLRHLLVGGLEKAQLPADDDIADLIAQTGKYITDSWNGKGSLSWIRLILPLRIGEDLIGLWLFGRRDPDDTYFQAEISVLQSLANQTAIALSNLLQTERLRRMYELNVERHERERLSLALDLHDSILNQLAILWTSFDDVVLSPNFQKAYEELVQRLRQIVSDLRPPMLVYGLKLALEELADNLMDRNNDTVKISVDIRVINEARPPENIEIHLYRVLQEACGNALRHSQAANIFISGQLDYPRIDLQVEDDGIGFDSRNKLVLDNLIENGHYGLAGIIERAELIGARITLDSTPGAGTRIRISLDSPRDD